MAKLKKINEVPEITEFGGGEKVILNQDGKARQINKDNLGFANDSEVLKKNEQELSEAEQMQARKNLGLYYTAEPVEHEFANGTYDFSYQDGSYINMMGINVPLIEGTIYRVTFDGIEYETECKVNPRNGYYYIGAIEFIDGSGAEPSMPFVYTKFGSESVCVTTTSGDHDVIISKLYAQAVKIPDEYLPDVFVNGDKELILSSSTANSTKKFKITVDDSGTLTATRIA